MAQAVWSKIKGFWFFFHFSVTKKPVDKASCVFLLSCHSEDSSPLLPVIVSFCADSLQRVFRGYIEIILGKMKDLEKIPLPQFFSLVGVLWAGKNNILLYGVLMQGYRRAAFTTTRAFLSQLSWEEIWPFRGLARVSLNFPLRTGPTGTAGWKFLTHH